MLRCIPLMLVLTLLCIHFTASGEDTLKNSLGMELKLIQPGTFKMGSPETEIGRRDDETPVREVTITKPFYIGVTEVTQEQWLAIMGANPSCFAGPPRSRWENIQGLFKKLSGTVPSKVIDPKRPVDNVTWDDVQAFLKKLSEKEKVIYRLPTEAEWEYACRAGTQTPYYWGDKWNDEYGWCNSNSGHATHNVGMKKPNTWGLYDMIGNVAEWCQDWHGLYPVTAKATDPQGSSVGQRRVLRGGSFYGDSQPHCRSAHRGHFWPDGTSIDIGFRVVRTP